MTVKLTGPMLPPRAGGAPTSLVVLLHGYGSDGNDLIGLGDVWAGALPHTLFVAPNGPAACDINPYGYQWFALDLQNPASRIAGAGPAGETIAMFLADLWREIGLGAAQTVIAGFSQGAMMALHVGLALAEPPAGIIAFSGALIPAERVFSRSIPILLAHGALDPVVDPGESRRAETALKALGHDVGLHVSPAIGHSISPEGLATAAAFLERVLPG